LGVHVEGPFITPSQLGAHKESCLRTAPNGFNDFADIYGLQDHKDHAIKIITVAPDVEGVLDSFEDLINFGITISIGILPLS
jgi:N-acetylglucosamine-6-phosphate deacetylase